MTRVALFGVLAMFCAALAGCASTTTPSSETSTGDMVVSDTLDSTAPDDLSNGDGTVSDQLSDGNGSDSSVSDANAADSLGDTGGSDSLSDDAADGANDVTLAETDAPGGDAQASGKVSVLITAAAGGKVELPNHVILVFPAGAVDQDTTITIQLEDTSAKFQSGALKAFSITADKAITILKNYQMTIKLDCKGQKPVGNSAPIYITAVESAGQISHIVGDLASSGLQVYRFNEQDALCDLASTMDRLGTVALFKTHVQLSIAKLGDAGEEVTVTNTHDKDLRIGWRRDGAGAVHYLRLGPQQTGLIGQSPAGSCDADKKIETVRFQLRGRYDISGAAPSAEAMLLAGGYAYLNDARGKSAWFGTLVEYTRPCTIVSDAAIDPRKTTFTPATVFAGPYTKSIILGTLQLVHGDGSDVTTGGTTVTFRLFDGDGVEFSVSDLAVKDPGNGSYVLYLLNQPGLKYHQRGYSLIVSLKGRGVGQVFRFFAEYPQLKSMEELDGQEQLLSGSTVSYTASMVYTKRTVANSGDPYVGEELELTYEGTVRTLGPLDFLRAFNPTRVPFYGTGADDPITQMVYDAPVMKHLARTRRYRDAKSDPMVTESYKLAFPTPTTLVWTGEVVKVEFIWDPVQALVSKLSYFYEKDLDFVLDYSEEFTFDNVGFHPRLIGQRRTIAEAEPVVINFDVTYGFPGQALNYVSDKPGFDIGYAFTYSAVNKTVEVLEAGAKVILTLDDFNLMKQRRIEEGGKTSRIYNYSY